MNETKRRWFTRLGAGLLALTLTASACPPALAQEEPAAEGESKGRPLDGYFGAAILAFGALFLIGKSARR
jgi:hypothetical protein